MVRTLLFFFTLFILLPLPGFADTSPSGRESRTVLEGTVSFVSQLPPAKGNPYPDCYFTVIAEVAQIIEGHSIPKRIVLVLPGFFGREYAPESHYKVGDRFRATVVPFGAMPEKVRQTQQADDSQDVDLEFYYPEKISLTDQLLDTRKTVAFTTDRKSSHESISSGPIDGKAREIREEAMRRDLKRINELLAEHGGNYDKWHDSLKGFRYQYGNQNAAKVQKWVDDSFFSAGQITDGKIYSPDFVKSIIAFKDFLAARNIDLIVVRVPYKGEVADDIFSTAQPGAVTNPYLLRMYKELLEADVEIITDIIPMAKSERSKYPLMYWYQAFAENHPAEGIAWVIAKAFFERISRYNRIQTHPKTQYMLKQVTTGMDLTSHLWSDLGHNPRWPEGNPKFSSDEFIKFASVITNNGKPLRFNEGSDSPVLMIGSSYLQTPSQDLGANIPAYLAYLTGVAPEILTRSGGDRSMPRLIVRKGDAFLKNRSVCLFPLVPSSINSPLESLIVIDPSKYAHILLQSLSRESLQNALIFDRDTQKSTYAYLPDGSLKIQALNKERLHNFRFSLNLATDIFKYGTLMIEIESQPGDGAAIIAKYGSQSETVYKNYRKQGNTDTFTFKVSTDDAIFFTIGNIRLDTPTIIKSIKVYGLK